jgi:hypothetical protein
MDAVYLRNRYDELESLRKTLDDTFQDIERLVVPYRGEFFETQTSELEVDWRRTGIFDSTAPIAADLLASSIHSNLTSPSIPWFQLRFRNDKLNNDQEAKEWLENIQDQIWQTLKESDFNMEIAETYLDLVSYGTAILFQEELSDTEWQGETFTAMPVRDTYFEHGADDKVLRVFRRLMYTALQLRDKWPDADWSNLDDDVDTMHRVIFCVFNRPEIKTISDKMAPEKRPWGYKYVMHDTGDELEEGGYYQMPAHVVRWKKVSGSRWGHSPAFVCLSDIRQLNETVAMVTEARAMDIAPPMKTTDRGLIGDLDLRPNGLTTCAAMDELDRLLPPHDWVVADVEINRLQESVRSTFYIDKLELKESPAMTATEVMARLDKQQRQFAPTLGRLEADLLDPLIEWTFDALARRKVIPPVPQSVIDSGAGQYDIEYTGPIPRSMKNEEAQGTSMWTGELTMLASQGLTEVLDVVNQDAMAIGQGFSRGVPAMYMNSEEDIAAIRDARAQAQKEAAAAEQLKQVASAGKDLAAMEQMGGE